MADKTCKNNDMSPWNVCSVRLGIFLCFLLVFRHKRVLTQEEGWPVFEKTPWEVKLLSFNKVLHLDRQRFLAPNLQMLR